MDLDFSEDQEILRDTVRGLCEQHASVDVVRAMENDAKGYSDELWQKMAELGILGLVIPEEFGGSAQPMLEAAIVYEELGRSLAPSPHFVSSILSASILRDAGSDEQKAEWLPKISDGSAILTPACLEPDRGFGAQGIALQARADGDSFILDGMKRHVHFASSADQLIVIARTGSSEADIDLFLVDPKSGGIELNQQMSLAADTQYEVRFNNVRVPASAQIGSEGSGWGAWHNAMNDGIILLAAQAMGGAERALEITVEYAKVREQFDKPLGAFQAISHYLADADTKIDGGKVLVWEAAWARSEDRSIDRLAPMAKLFACQTYRDVTAMCQQVWGGVGFTLEYDIQLYFRRAKQLQLTWWDTRYLEELVASDILDN